MELVIITGISGAGKTLGLRILEDLDYYCLDNLPPQLIPDFYKLTKSRGVELKKVAVSTDIRSKAFLSDFFSSLDKIKELGVYPTILFLEAKTEVLVRRFSETRRKHPLAQNRPISEMVEEERELMKEIRANSDIIIDTSNFKWMDLRDELINIFYKEDKAKKTKIIVMSFGFKYGIPLDTDLLFDVRFLPNPHYLPELRPLTGEDEPIKKYLWGYEITRKFWEKLKDFIELVVPEYISEEKRYLTISFGCTGGKHRSVFFARKLTDFLEDNNYSVYLKHRDRNKK